MSTQTYMGESPAAASISVQSRSATDASTESFDVLYETHFDFIWRVLRRLGVDVTLVDDACQDVFITAYRQLPNFEGRSSLRTWLYGIAVNIARDYRRKARRIQEPLQESTTRCDRPDPHAASEQVQAVELLDRLLAELDTEKREVLVLAEIAQLRAPEIARLLGIKLPTVYSRLRLARSLLKKAARRFEALSAGGRP